MKLLRTPSLEVALLSGGPADGPAVLLLHGWPDDARAWGGITSALETAGYQWAAPWLRGFGATRFLSDRRLRDGSAVALAQDALDLADVLQWPRFAVVGHDWGGRAAYVLAAIAPERLTSIAAIGIGYSPRGRFPVPTFEQSRRWWYQWFMTVDGGAQAIRDDPVAFARIQWETWSPPGWFDEVTFARTAESFLNPDWVDITLHGYRGRWQPEALDPAYELLRAQLARVETLSIPTLMVQGGADACDPPRESENQARYFSKGYERVVLEGVGHFAPRESPAAVARAVLAHLQGHR